ncbi:dihydrolipoyl dehydrogenase [Psychrobacter lutiphocae]|uniref:dihydrolipoyl dehydrogenase n=1 Tax=Psychrobacter lutiphocae TaxID=540500 RepID=UPI0003684780|nr:dihydrolipoyl dehydrogenase [Psychrobacter lutiphocae]
MSTSLNTSKPNRPTRTVDVAIIGAGTAGHNAYHQVTKVTNNVVVINDGYWTTTCATVGCMPSKLLIAAAERAHYASDSAEFGIEGSPSINGKQVMQRVQAERNRFAGFLQKSVENWRDDQKIHGHATFTPEGYIAAAGEIIQAKYIIVGTGSVPYAPEGWADKLGDRLLSSDSVFEIPDLPKSIAILGAGAIGLEFSQALHRLGVDVTLFNRSQRIGGIRDPKINEVALECVLDGLNTELGSTVTDVTVTGTDDSKQAKLFYTDANGNQKSWQGDYILVAIGRRNTLHNMNIENVGVELDARNRPLNVDAVTGQIGDSNIYVVGDANARLPLMHVASNEGYHSGQHIKALIEQEKYRSIPPTQGDMPAQTSTFAKTSIDAIVASGDCGAEMLCDDDISGEIKDAEINDGKVKEGINDDINANINADKSLADSGKPYEDKPATPLAVVFCEPQIASVGQTIPQLEAANIAYVTGQVSFNNQGRSRVMGVNCGMLHIYAQAETGLILGASMVGPDAEYIAHILGVAITNALSLDDMLASPYYHPTILEGLRTALRNTRSKLTKK